MAAVLWALIVEPNSRGNALGDQLHAAAALDTHIVTENSQLVNDGRHIREHSEMCAETVTTLRMLSAAACPAVTDVWW